MHTETKFPTPPWDMDIAAERLTWEEAAWNTHDPELVAAGYAENIEMRDGLTFVSNKEQLIAFIRKRFADQLDYKVKLFLWGALKARMAVRFEAEWHDGSGQWFRSYGVQVFQFTDTGLVEHRYASQERESIAIKDRRLTT